MVQRIVNRFSELLALKERRERRKYSRREIASITGVSLTSIQNWAYNRNTQYHEEQMLAFCEFFDCKLGELLVVEEVEAESEKNTLPAAS